MATKYLFVIIILFSLAGIANAACDYTINAGESVNKYNSAVQPGQTVCIKAGTYNETLQPTKNGSSGSLITYKASPGDECKTNADKTKYGCNVILGGGIALGNRSYVRAEGFEVTGGQITADSSSGVEIAGNHIHGYGGTGIYCTVRSTNILIENNEINDLIGPEAFAILLDANGATIRGNFLHHNDNDGIHGGGFNWIVENNLMGDSYQSDYHQDGFDFAGLRDSKIRYNTIYDFTQLLYFALKDYTNVYAKNLDIYGNLFYNLNYYPNTSPGIFIDASAGNNEVSNVNIHSNTFGYLGMPSIMVQTSSGITMGAINIYDNIFYEGGIDIQSGFTVNSNYNLFNTGVGKPAFEGSNSVSGDPLFVNYVPHNSSHLNFHLSSNSPAINAGNPSLPSVVSLPSPFADIDGAARPQGTTFDIGAYEFANGTTQNCAGTDTNCGSYPDCVACGTGQSCVSNSCKGIQCTAPQLAGYIDQWKLGTINLQTLMQKIALWKAGQPC